ncbi:DNA-directed RNA polymerase subunit beta [Nitriliruptor alkaliphilus]|uniref:DNA-directed RNA polymerase subunit beta n=1 Tax=Nitriliruptor alkaliphilus TaxID=427918 RepID=UPI0006979605|nr:DNA-directed RNA polymerase subunit beta [Nitriliruptor alkaliphilus]
MTGNAVDQRLSFAKIREALPLEELDLVAIQSGSFAWLIDEGLGEIFDEISPIEDSQGKMALSFLNHRFEDPKYSVDECKEKDYTYAAPLFVTAEFLNKEDGTIKSQTVFMGDFPVMSDKGTFVINGTERVVVSQLVRSPGVYFDSSIDKTTGRDVYGCKVIPGRGAWLEFEVDKRDLVAVRVDRKRKQPISVFYRALKAFVWNQEAGVYELAPSEVLTTEIPDEEILEFFGGAESIALTLEKDNTGRTPGQALEEIYRKLRPGEPPNAEQAGQLLLGMFFATKKYDLARVGRYKISGLEDDGSGHVKHGKLTDEFELLGFGRREDVTLTAEDCLATMSYLVKLHAGEDGYDTDDIDHFGNRRLRSVGELIQNQVRIGLSRMERVVRERMTTQDLEAITPQTLINIRPVVSAIREFFGTSQLSQFLDETNPLSGLTHKRRMSALGPGGLSRERAGFEVRDVHPSHYGRMCPIETPEGPNIGLIGTLATYARINEYGFVETPYRTVVDGVVTDDVEYLTADEEDRYVVAQANAPLDDEGKYVNDLVLVRAKGGEVREVAPSAVDYMDVSPRQAVSISAALIPFLEHDDANRALMGANMQRQAVPLLRAEAPFVGTGIEAKAARDAGDVVVASRGGVLVEVASDHLVVRTDDDEIDRYYLTKFKRSNQGSCINQRPIVTEGQRIEVGEVIADGPSTDAGELALGRNLLVAFMSWEGYNFEDAIILSERLVREDVLTSIHIGQLEVDARETKLGPEEITRDIPNVSEEVLANLDEEGIIRIGAEVQPGDILVGKVTPKGETELTPEERLLRAIFGEKAREVRDTSLKVPHGDRGIVIGVQRFSRADGDELPPGVNDMVRIFIAKKSKISEGDKLAGRHGNKGVISKILPLEDMPFLEDGTPVDIVLNPLGVPSRMNIGQVLETHLGWAASNGWHFDEKPEWFDRVGWGDEMLSVPGPVNFATPVFDGCREEELIELLQAGNPTESGIRLVGVDGKTTVYEGRSGEAVEAPVTVGYMYILKLHHLVDDKIHARSTGPYSMITQQPLGGKAQFGGQRFGEMEVWALEAYGAAYALQELLTIKSDDTIGRVKVYEAIVKGDNIPEPGIPESFKVLVKEMQALSLNVEVLNAAGDQIELRDSEDDAFRAAEALGIDLSRPERPTAEA